MPIRPIAARALRAQVRPASDAALLTAARTGGDEIVFEEIVNRHGPMVLRVCRRALGRGGDAEDAFQATFIVLLRRAATIGKPDSLGSWLHGVAVRVSHELRAARRRRATVPLEEDLAGPRTPCRLERDEIAAVLDAELANLPPLYRAPVVLCEVQGRSRREAADELGIREGTLSSRLAKAKRLLAERLEGKFPAAVALGAIFGERTLAGVVPPVLTRSTVRLVIGCSFGEPAPGAVPGAIHAVANGVATSMRTSNLRGMILAVALLFVAVGGLVSAWPGPRPESAPPAVFLPISAAAPVPAPRKPDDRIWVKHLKTGKLVALSPTGRPIRELTLKDGPFVFRIAPADDRLWFAGREGRSVEPTPDGGWPDGKFTLHVRAVDEKTTGEDLGIEVNDTSVLAPDGKTLGSVILKQAGQVAPANEVPIVFENVLVDVATKKVTKLDVPASHQLIDIAGDGAWALTLEYTLSRGEKGVPPFRIHKVPVGGGKPQLLSGTLSTMYPSRISPDGKRALIFALEMPAKDKVLGDVSAYVIDVGTGKATRIAGEKKQLWSAGVWSPDGKRVAYAWRARTDAEPIAADGVGPTRLVVCDADGKNASTILTADDMFMPIAWW